MSKAIGNVTIEQVEGGVVVEYRDESASIFAYQTGSRKVICKTRSELETVLRTALPALPNGDVKPEPPPVKDAGEFETKAPEPKFKVGDRVIGNGGYSFDPIEGEVVKVAKRTCDVRVIKSARMREALRFSSWPYRFGELKHAAAEIPSQHPMNAEAIRDTDEKEAKLRRDIELACALFGCFPVAP